MFTLRNKRLIAPVLLALLGVGGTIVFWRTLGAHERRESAANAHLMAEHLFSQLATAIQNRVVPVERLAERGQESHSEFGRANWQNDASLIGTALSGYRLIEWINPRREISWSVPVKPSDLGLSIQAHDRLALGPLTRARGTRKPVGGEPVRLPGNGSVLFVCAPVFHQTHFDGWVAGILDFSEIARDILSEARADGFEGVLESPDGLVYANGAGQTRRPEQSIRERTEIYGTPFQLTVWEQPQRAFPRLGLIRAFVLTSGSIASILFGLALFLAGAARERAKELEGANARLAASTEDLNRSSEALRQTNETLRAVIEAAPLAIIVLDLEGNVKRWNRSAEKMFGWAAEEVVGQPVPIVPEDDMEFVRTNLRKLAAGQTLSGVERKRLRKDGSLVDVAIWTAPERDASGTVRGVVSLLADISERKRLEQRVRESQRLEIAGRLAGGVAHFFNNLLMIIVGYSRMLLDKLHPSSFVYPDIQEILNAADRAAAITKLLLASSGRDTAQPQRTDLNHVVRTMQEVLPGVLGPNIDVITNLGEAGPVWIDPAQIEHILISLAINAREAMPAGGKLTLATSNVQVASDAKHGRPDVKPGDYVLLAITDTGRGMDEETKRHLFEPFYTTKGLAQGTGLGLSSIYGITRQYGGDVSVISEPGKGASFRIYLPRMSE